MKLWVIGISHQQLSLSARERWVMPAAQLPRLMLRLRALPCVQECLLLSTCNRSECMVVTDNQLAVQQWFCQYCGQDAAIDSWSGYAHEDLAAASHLMRLASGMLSAVIGETQILGQLKQAYVNANEAGVIGPILRALMPAVFHSAKGIRSNTVIGEKNISLAQAVLCLAKRFFTPIKQVRVLVIACGDMAQMMLQQLCKAGVSDITVVARDLSKAVLCAQQYGVHAAAWSTMPEHLARVDWVIGASAAMTPVIDADAIATAFLERAHAPLLMTDLAMPRDFAPACDACPDVYLYDLDMLQKMVNDNRAARAQACLHAEELVEQAAQSFWEAQRLRVASAAVSRCRQDAAELRDQALQDALFRLRAGKPADAVIKQLAHELTNKLLHAPTVKLRQALKTDQQAIIKQLEQLFIVAPEGSET